MSRIQSFTVLSQASAKVLILGSIPSAVSIDAGQYYAHPRNAFWKIIESVYAIPHTEPYKTRTESLLSRDVALWDVLKSCDRLGSLDSAIVSDTERPNDFVAFLDEYKHIQRICFNGKKAESMFKKHVLKRNPVFTKHFDMYSLPSTSPAYAAMGFDEKMNLWKNALTGALD